MPVPPYTQEHIDQIKATRENIAKSLESLRRGRAAGFDVDAAEKTLKEQDARLRAILTQFG